MPTCHVIDNSKICFFFHFEESEMEYNNVELNESESIIWALNVTKREHWFIEEIHCLNWIHKKRILKITLILGQKYSTSSCQSVSNQTFLSSYSFNHLDFNRF